MKTPYLAAVVKGTTFEVTVDALGATVDVEEGLVDVGSALSGERTLVPGGERVRVLRTGRFDGGRPASFDSGRGTMAALNQITVEVAPEDDSGGQQARSHEFAALDVGPVDRDAFDGRRLRDRRSGDGVSTPALERVVAARPRLPVSANPDPVSGTPSTAPANRDDDDRDFDYDRERFATYWERLRQAYRDYKNRDDDDDDHDDVHDDDGDDDDGDDNDDDDDDGDDGDDD